MSARETSGPVLSSHAREEIDRWVARFPQGQRRSAVISALRVAQHENGGFLTPELMDAVADYLGLPPVQVYEVATFYSMFETRAVGRHHVSVCTNVSCMLRGGDELLAHVETRLGIRVGESTSIWLMPFSSLIAWVAECAWFGSGWSESKRISRCFFKIST